MYALAGRILFPVPAGPHFGMQGAGGPKIRLLEEGVVRGYLLNASAGPIHFGDEIHVEDQNPVRAKNPTQLLMNVAPNLSRV